MPSCPNCGRQTLRTKDWACQWCGYPLVSRAFKKIDKTFKELQEERSLTSRSAQSEEEEEFEPEYTPEPEPEPEPPPRTRPPVKPAYRPVPEPRPAPKPEPKLAPETVSRPVEPPVPQQPVIQLPSAETAPAPPPRAEVAPAPEPLITPPPLPKQELPSASKPVAPPPAPKPEIKIQSEPAPIAMIKLEEIQDGTEITADQIDALFRADKSAANSKFVGKTLVISGIVEKVFVREHLEIRYIMLTGTQKKMMWSLRCTFDKDESSKLTRLNEGQAVVVRGKYDSYSKNVIFKECVLV